MFISVDLPAPFSPSSACTSPLRRSKSTWSFATMPGEPLGDPAQLENGPLVHRRDSMTASATVRRLDGRRSSQLDASSGMFVILPADDLVLRPCSPARRGRPGRRGDLAEPDGRRGDVEDGVLAALEAAVLAPPGSSRRPRRRPSSARSSARARRGRPGRRRRRSPRRSSPSRRRARRGRTDRRPGRRRRSRARSGRARPPCTSPGRRSPASTRSASRSPGWPPWRPRW